MIPDIKFNKASKVHRYYGLWWLGKQYSMSWDQHDYSGIVLHFMIIMQSLLQPFTQILTNDSKSDTPASVWLYKANNVEIIIKWMEVCSHTLCQHAHFQAVPNTVCTDVLQKKEAQYQNIIDVYKMHNPFRYISVMHYVSLLSFFIQMNSA